MGVLGPNPKLVIALHSPKALLGAGLRVCLPEKARKVTAFGAAQSVLSGPVCLGTIAKYGYYSSILPRSGRNFSAVQTAWRRERDSNPPVRFPVQRFSSSPVASEPFRKFSTLLESSTAYQNADSLRHNPFCRVSNMELLQFYYSVSSARISRRLDHHSARNSLRALTSCYSNNLPLCLASYLRFNPCRRGVFSLHSRAG